MKNFESFRGHQWRLVFDANANRFCWVSIGTLMGRESNDNPVKPPSIVLVTAETCVPKNKRRKVAPLAIKIPAGSKRPAERTELR